LKEEDADAALLSVLGTAFKPKAVALPVRGEIWSVLPVMMKWELVLCSKQWTKSREVEGRSEKWWDLACRAASSFICMAGDNVMTHFLRKRCISVSTTCVTRSWDWGSEKFRSLKDFEIYGVQEKRLLVNGSTDINPIGTVICPK
jgi:hypothetical protein